MGKNVTSWEAFRLAETAYAAGFKFRRGKLLRSNKAIVLVRFLLPLSGTCYTRCERAVAERNASWERRPQQIISRGTFHEWPDAERPIHLCALAPTGSGQPETRRRKWRDMAEWT